MHPLTSGCPEAGFGRRVASAIGAPTMTLARAFLAAALILVLGACAYMAPYQPPSTYYVMRHLHTPEGAADPGLTEEGQRHARLLADFFPEEPPAATFLLTTKTPPPTDTPPTPKPRH